MYGMQLLLGLEYIFKFMTNSSLKKFYTQRGDYILFSLDLGCILESFKHQQNYFLGGLLYFRNLKMCRACVPLSTDLPCCWPI